MTVYNCGQFRAIIAREHSSAVDVIVKEFQILDRKDVWSGRGRAIELSSCGCRSEVIRKALSDASVPFEDMSTSPSVEERPVPFLPQRYL